MPCFHSLETVKSRKRKKMKPQFNWRSLALFVNLSTHGHFECQWYLDAWPVMTTSISKAMCVLQCIDEIGTQYKNLPQQCPQSTRHPAPWRECQNERCEHYEADEVYFKPIFHLRKVGGGELWEASEAHFSFRTKSEKEDVKYWGPLRQHGNHY